MLDGDASRHWYYRSKAAALSHYLAGESFARILDVGAGSGFFSRHLLLTTHASEAMCVDPNYERDWDEEVNGKPLKFRRSASDYVPNLILMMDVLEHVDDDLALLRAYTDAAPAKTRVLVTVPAFAFLWSRHDVFLDHKRRYTLAHLRTVMEGANLSILGLSYFFGLVFPLAVAVRFLDRFKTPKAAAQSGLKSHHPIIDVTLETLCLIERPWMKFNKLAGLSVFCLARKP